MLYGAIAGDIAGSTREFCGMKDDEKELFPEGSAFTDDTILTLAVAEATRRNSPMAEMIRKMARDYPHPMGGYGSMFEEWLWAGENAPAYASFGNGSAMRVSACAWAADDIGEVQRLARLSAECTHNHPEGVKGAVATASAVFMARRGCTKESIRRYVHEHFYDMSRSYEELYAEDYEFHATCQDTVPEALICFFESEDFEDALRMAMLVNRDTDTAAAICGAVAGAYYGVPEKVKKIVRSTLDARLLAVLDGFEEWVRQRMTQRSVPMENCFRVGDERIWGCEYPFDLDEEVGIRKLQGVLDFGITHFIDLTEEGELRPYSPYIPCGAFVEHRRCAIPDMGVPASCESMLEILKSIDLILQGSHAKVCLHCWGGVGRTGLVVACWIAWRRRLGFFDTMEVLYDIWTQCPKSLYRDIPDTGEQTDFIRRFIEYIQA